MSDKTELDALVKLTEEFVTATWHLLDNSETSGPKDDPTITVWQPNFDEVSALLDRCEGLPSGSMEHIAAGELLAANLISAITTLRAQLAVAEACNRGLVRLNEATQDRADRAEIKLAKAVEAEKSAFSHGYVIACCNLQNLHDMPEVACDVLQELGVSAAQIKAMDLSEYDAKALRQIRKGRKDDPVSKRRKGDTP